MAVSVVLPVDGVPLTEEVEEPSTFGSLDATVLESVVDEKVD